MMKDLRILLGVLAAMLSLTGCVGSTSLYRVEAVPADYPAMENRKVVGVVYAENRGAFLFNCIPLWSGHPTFVNRRDHRTFRNYLKPGYTEMTLEIARKNTPGAQMVSGAETSRYHSAAFSLWTVWLVKERTRAFLLGAPLPEK